MNNQPAIGVQHLGPQNLAHNLPPNTNTSFDNLTADEKFEILDKGTTTDPFAITPKTTIQEPMPPTDILLGFTFE